MFRIKDTAWRLVVATIQLAQFDEVDSAASRSPSNTSTSPTARRRARTGRYWPVATLSFRT